MSRKKRKISPNKEKQISNTYIDPDEYIETEEDNKTLDDIDSKSGENLQSEDDYVSTNDNSENDKKNEINEQDNSLEITNILESKNSGLTDDKENIDMEDSAKEDNRRDIKKDLKKDSNLKKDKSALKHEENIKESELAYEGDAFTPTVIIKKEEIQQALQNNHEYTYDDTKPETEGNTDAEETLISEDDSGYVKIGNEYDYEELDFGNDYIGNSSEFETDDEYYEDNEESDEDITKYDDHGFAKFTGEVVNDAHDVAKKYVFIILAIFIICAIILLLYFSKKDNKEALDASQNSENSIDISESTNDISPDALEELKPNESEEINELITTYFNSMKTCDIDTISSIENSTLSSIEQAKIIAKAEYVEDYRDIEIYTKKGPYDNSFIAYVKYVVKLKNWEQTAPSLLTLLVCPKDDGGYYLFSGEFDENIAEYIKTASSTADVVDLINKVDAEYKETLDSDIEFNEYMNALNQTIKDDVGEMIASEKNNETSSNDISDVSNNDVSSNNISDNDASTSGSYEVKTTTTVNVRISDSENADKLGKAEQGMTLTCTQEKPNGWSQVIFEGQTAYIKTEFLIKVDSGTDGNSTDQNIDTGEAKGTVRVKETVNIRAKATTDSGLLGVAYMGETFPLLEIQSDGWSKIKYNNQVAYVKTEFLEQQ